MTEKTAQVIVFPRGQLSAKDKERLTKAGIVAVEAENPDSVVQLSLRAPMVLESTIVSGDAVVRSLLAAMAAQKPSEGGYDVITSTGRAAHAFVTLLSAAVNPKGQS